MRRWAFGLLLVGLMAVPTTAHSDTDYRTYASLGAVANAGTQRTTFDVPAGTTATKLTGSLKADGALEGKATVLIGERVAATYGSDDSSSVDIPLGPGDVVDGSISVGLLYEPELDDDVKCRVPDTSRVTLDDVQLALAGDPTKPTTVGDFFAPGVNRVTVVVPADADDDVLQAGLSAVGALSHRYGERAKVDLATTSSLDSPTSRDVAIESGTGDVVATIDTIGVVPKLTLTGGGDELAKAAAAFGSESIVLADDATATKLTDDPTSTGALNRTLESLGNERVQLGGYGRSTGFVQASQADFGGPVSQIDVTLKGQTSDIPKDVDASLSVFWNDFLIGSRTLTESEPLNWHLKVSNTLLRSGNGLTLQVDAIPRDGDCVGVAALPIRVDIDGRASSLQATRGASGNAGFGQFPQALGGNLPVALGGDGGSRTAQAVDASRIVAALQRATRTPLAIDLISADKLTSGSESGLLVGADAAVADKLKAPLRFGSFRQISGNNSEFAVETNQPFAALEAFRTGGRNLLMLGGWQSGSETLAARIAKYVEARPDGWNSLSGDLVVMTASTKQPTTLASTTLVPQEKVADDFRGYAKWVLLGLGALTLLALGGALVERRRRKAVKAYVDAQEADDGHGHGTL